MNVTNHSNLKNVSLKLDFISKYFNLKEDELMNMSLSELIFLNNEAENLNESEIRSEKMKNKVDYWIQFLEPYLNYLKKLGFNESDIKKEMTKYSDRDYYKEEAFKKGQKPYYGRKFVKLNKEGNHHFLIPRTRSGRTENLPADFYHISNVDESFLEKLMLPLIFQKYPFLKDLKFKMYGLKLKEEEDGSIVTDSELYVHLEGVTWSTLYVPLQAILNGDKQIIIDRQKDYIETYFKRSSDELLEHKDTLNLFNNLDLMKKNLGGN